MKFQIEADALHLSGKIGREDVTLLITALTEYIQNQEDSVILDLSDVETMDTMALQTFIATKRSVKQANKTFKLFNINEGLKEIFNITGMDAVFKNSIDQKIN